MDMLARSCVRSVLVVLMALLTLCSLGICQQECNTPVELGFLVDRSGSISKQNYDKVKSFIMNVIAGFDVSREGTHIGIISYSSDAKTVISFDQFDDPNFDYGKLNETIRESLAYPEGGNTRIDLALQKADRELFSDITKYRSFVPKILLVLTDGQQSRDDETMDVSLSEETKKLGRKGVEVFVLGVGNSVNIPEMLEIAADKEENLYQADNFDELEMVVESLVSSFCKVCSRDVDVVFLIPTVSDALQDVKSIVNAMLLTFGIRKYEGVHVGILTCAEQGDVALKLNELYVKLDIQDILESLPMKGSRVFLDKCLKEASSSMFNVIGGVRNAVDKYLVVFDDGGSSFLQPAVNNALSTLKSQGVIVMGMSIGSDPAAESKMRAISHEPKSVWFKQIRAREVQNAASFARSVSETLCKEKPGKCPYIEESEACEDDVFYDECDVDSDRASPCPGDTICCDNPCGRRCVSPMPDCFSPVEIALLVDSSGSQGDRHKEDILRKFKRFSKQLLNGFSVTESAARVAVVTYSDEAKVHMDLGSGQPFSVVQRNIDNVKLSDKPDRNLEEALRFTKENVFSLKGGLRKIGGRVLVVFSSGEPTNRERSLSSAAQSLTDQGVEIWAVHGGEDTSSYLTEVVSQSSHLLSSLDGDLEDFQKNFVMSVCSSKEGICRSPVCPSDGTDQCRQDYVCPGQEKCCPGTCLSCVETKTDCRYPMDLAFIVQNSMSESEFREVKSFMKSVLNALEVGRTQTYVGVVTFNKEAKINLEFSSSIVSDAENKRQVLFDAIDKIGVSRDSSTTGAVEAFELAKNRLFTREAGAHPNEIMNMIFISNGKFKQPEDVAESAKSLRADISNIFPFAVTKDVDVDTLQKIAVPDGEKHVYLTTSYGALDQYGNKIAVELCKRGFLEASNKISLIARRKRDLQSDSGARLAREKESVVLVEGPPGNGGAMGNEGGRGEPGPQGNKGAAGAPGPLGEPGDVGGPGNPGIAGLLGPVGPPGDITIERSGDKGVLPEGFIMRKVDQNFTAIIETELGKNLIPGARGPKGIKGMPGPMGLVGEFGEIGKPGLCGSEGVTGAIGRTGIPGLQGSRGISGSPGEPGVVGEKGGVGDAGSKGAKGQKGPRGDVGEQGIEGENGEMGDPGELGVTGFQGPRGKKGARGDAGNDGEEGFTGFIGGQGDDGLRGLTGDKGKRGPPGPVGFTGISGLPGFEGPVGFYGIVGEPGAVGDIGGEGIKGTRGANGLRGEDGPPGKPGELGGSGSKGLPGFRGHKGQVGLKGETGEDAENGEMGVPGTDGVSGGQGDRGILGEKGETGVNGLPGSKGKLGLIGQAGLQGGRGPDGPPGPKGDLGPDGRDGPPGLSARPGYIGNPGNRGEKGERGDAGPVGKRGIPGQKGFPGEPGVTGFPGTGGSPGRPGSDGSYGPHGSSGDPGPSGTPGQRGPRGQQGRPGQDGEPGSRGPIGEKGFPGPPGFPGQPGVAAPPGPTGEPGEPGDIGRAGGEGSVGFVGQIGEDGPTGDKGPLGSEGVPGPPGKPGKPGLKGSQGHFGDKGFPGRQGAVGSRGVRGPPGPKGAPGTVGEDGGRGPEGSMGPRGQIGQPGLDGIKGDLGRRGKPGLAGQNGFPGENGGGGDAGLDGFKGDKGAVGDPGRPGQPGEPGRDGLPGPTGLPGDLGPAGLEGASGPNGLPGMDGRSGPKGPEGDAGQPGGPGINGGPGFPGLSGAVGARGERGQKGASGSGTLPGEPGSRGPEGFQGSLGRPGPPGRTGGEGEKGDIGFSGDEGEQGEKGSLGTAGGDGDIGAKGAKGSKGDRGDKGQTGEPGLDGDPGPPGKSGGTGEPGLDGLPGGSGAKGANGMKGDQGEQGPVGTDGEPGQQGPMGTEGTIGENGDSSSPGHKGMPGEPGEPGISVNGTAGPPGPPGLPGDSGLSGPKGEKGAPGPTGSKGSMGMRGENGTVGGTGISGKPGSKGLKGDTGRIGVNATQGMKGEKGNVGLPGQGVKGDRGAVGPPGADGARGPPGPTVNGSKGLAGSPGPKGVRGSQGPPGPPGRAGLQAVSFNGTTISIRHNATYTEYIPVDLNSNISRRYFNIQRNLALYKKPNGSQLFPAISCAVLYSHYPQIESGRYSIDPNQGSHEDAEEVYCDFEKNATCLEPVRNKIENKKWFSGPDGYRWVTEELNEVQNTNKFNYTFDDGQLQMLQLHSSKAWQRITYHCLNSVPWGNSTQQKNAIKLQGDDDLEFHNKMPRKLRPVAIEDNCQTKNDTWRKTILEVQARDPANLPIRDIAVYDVGDDGEEFGLELGRVCFAP